MKKLVDGPRTANFNALPLQGHLDLDQLAAVPGISEALASAAPHASRGSITAWGIPFEVEKVILLTDQAVSVAFPPLLAPWLVFLHTSDVRPLDENGDGFIAPMTGAGRLNEHAADYVVVFADGSEARIEIRRRHQVGAFERRWGENCFQAVEQHKPHPRRAQHEQAGESWGYSQTRAFYGEYGPWVNWLWAWENPSPKKKIVGLRFEPRSGALVISGLATGRASQSPLRWQTRQTALLQLPEGGEFQPRLDADGLLEQIQLDLGQVISAAPCLQYPDESWETSYNNQLPVRSKLSLLVEYTAHPDACFHLSGGQVIPVAQVRAGKAGALLRPLPPANQRVRLEVREQGSGKRTAVKLHVHAAGGQYLAPVDRHRIINPAWFEDYSVDFSHVDTHPGTYISGECELSLPLGRVYLEVSKGFEIRPLRKVFEVTPQTEELVIEIERVLPWREKGWVTADTHVHFLSPISALLEGAAEGVNIVNLLASQWGELMTNVGDFDGKSTWGSLENGGDGEWLVRVGTENRQHVLGHISLLGYQGRIIAPMTSGGPNEFALGDPVEILLTEWARRCKQQGGLVVLPHFPQPRGEHAVSVVSGEIDAVEMTSWENLYAGISPYSLSDWYRYLNCGYRLAAVGGTDKMSATTAVGTVRTYARLLSGQPFTYEAWMSAVRRAETFVTYGPLLDFAVNGLPMGSRIELPAGGGTLDVSWEAASVTVPFSRVELIVNGEIRESVALTGERAYGHWSVRLEHSAWLALLVRGHYADQPEIVAAHSSPVMLHVDGTQLLAAADAVTILEQIEGALAYLDTIGTRAEDRAYKRMRLVMEAAHRSLHNRMHQAGHFHDHNPLTDHNEHHE